MLALHGLTPGTILNLETAVGQARLACQGVRWQGATAPLAAARQEVQRNHRTPWRHHRACRAFTHTVSLAVVHIVNGHGYLQRHERDQLPFI